MANWYVSSVAYAAIAPWAASTAYTVGQIVRPTAATNGKRLAQRCTTAGTSGATEPTWALSNTYTTTSGGAVFTVVNGDAYGWSGAAGDLSSVSNYFGSGFAANGDKIFLSSDHSETTSGGATFSGNIGTSWSALTTFIISVNRGGSVPPVASDITSGATITFGTIFLDFIAPIYIEGVTFIASGGNVNLGSSYFATAYYKNCSIQISDTNAARRIASSDNCAAIFDNTSLSFANSGQAIVANYSFELTWINTATPLLGTAPATLFASAGTSSLSSITCRGVDFSGYSGNFIVTASAWLVRALLDSCKISASATLFSGSAAGTANSLELVNCWDGTSVRNERYTPGGKVVTERTITLTGGAADDIGAFSLKMVSNASKIDKWVGPLDCFWLDVENTATGSSKTATVEIVSSGSLNNDDIWLLLEYMGTSGNPIAAFANSLPATPLSSNSAVTTSSASWASAPSTPVYQKLQVTFTPQRAGRVRAQVMLGKASTTVYVNPALTIS